jgi:murein DD-endopeptidase MepM/ murein hydrolase activator NlpD
LDLTRPRGAQRPRVAHEPIDLGNEPPLWVDGGIGGVIDRRRVSVHWFSGIVLTGLCGAALMGGAVFTALDGETSFASVPERFEGMLRSALGGGPDRPSSRKGDRLPTYSEPAVVRQVIRVTTTTRIGNREIVRVRPFVRVAGNLSLSVSELSAHIPPFNPQRMLAESASDIVPDAATAAAPDAEVSFITRDLAGLLPRVQLAVSTPVDEVLADVRQAVNWTGSTNRMAVPNLPGTRLAYATEGQIDPYAGFEARIVPQNITLLAKTTKEATGGNPWNERVVVPKKDETVLGILRGLGATPEEAKAIVDLLGLRGLGGQIKDGSKLRVLLAPTDGRRQKPIRVIVASESAVEAVVAFSDLGKYVSVDVRNANSEIGPASDDDEDNGTGVRLYESIYETALRDQMPRPVIEDLVRIYSYDVDYQRKVQPGDSFEVLYAAEDEAGGIDRAEVMFAELTVGGDTKKFYRFQTPDDGTVDYYDETGKSAKKFLVRKPIGVGTMRSGFGFRRHPILGYTKIHTGIDWNAPYGTPVFAAGNGIVEKADWESGYGKYIRIRHNNGYETAYGHLTAYARDIQEGVRVRQGQVIGFVGSTGLSTGAHVHYEIMVNGRFVDPMRIKLPRGRSLSGPVLAAFEQERDRIDAMKSRPSMRTAQTR